MLSIVSSMRRAVSQMRPRWQGPLAASSIAVTARRLNSSISMNNVADELMSKGNAPLTPPSVQGYSGGISYGMSANSNHAQRANENADEILLTRDGGFRFSRNQVGSNPPTLTLAVRGFAHRSA